MLRAFRLVYAVAALLSMAAGSLVVASLFIADRTPRSMEFLGVSLAVGAVFVGIGLLLLGVRRHVARIATLARGRDDDGARQLVTHSRRLLVHLLAGGAFLCVALGLLTFGILERIYQGSAVFG
jgi:hypothetical protein